VVCATQIIQWNSVDHATSWPPLKSIRNVGSILGDHETQI
jgi:hypothetical protein